VRVVESQRRPVPDWIWLIVLFAGGFAILKVVDWIWGLENYWIATGAIVLWVVTVAVLQRFRRGGADQRSF
jgi:hypothetical protein